MSKHAVESVIDFVPVDENNELLPNEIVAFPSRHIFRSYCVSNFGRIFTKQRSRRWRLMKPQITKDGYRVIKLYEKKKRYHFRMCRLVLITFKGEPRGTKDACHENGNCNDDRNDNLTWGTHQRNMRDKITQRLRKCGMIQSALDLQDKIYNDHDSDLPF